MQSGCWSGETWPTRFPAVAGGERVLRCRRVCFREVRDILTTRRLNGEDVPPEGMPCSMGGGLRTLGRNPRADSASVAYETGGSRIPGRFGTGPRDERGEMVTPTGGIIPAALVLRGQALRGEHVSHRTADVWDEVPIGLGHSRDEVPDGLGYPIAVLGLAVAPRESGSRVREENRPSEARALLPLSPGMVLPRFPDRAVPAVSAQIVHDSRG